MEKPDTEALTAALRRVIDPEVGMNIVDLGLVFVLIVVISVLRARRR